MRILTLTCEYPPVGGGGASSARTLVHELSRQGADVEVVTARMKNLPSHAMDGPIPVHRTGGYRRRRFYSTATEQATFLPMMWHRSAGLLRSKSFDLIHSHFVLPTSSIAWRLARDYDVPYVVTAHGSDVPGYNPERFATIHTLVQPVWKRIVRDAAAITAPSQFLVGLIRQRLDVPVACIANPAELPKAATTGRATPPVVLAVGRLVERKGYRQLLQALAKRHAHVKLVVAGDGPIRGELEAMAQELGLNCEFIGFVDRTTLEQHYARASIFVMPSLQENFPMVLLEAMGSGLAVITSDCAGCLEVVGDAAIVARAGDTESLQQALTRVLDHPDQIAVLGEAARQRSRMFAADHVAAQYLDLFERSLRVSPANRRGASVKRVSAEGQCPSDC